MTNILRIGNKPAFISTHTPLAGRDHQRYSVCLNVLISTHTPLAGRDVVFNAVLQLRRISTHTPLAGRDLPAYFLKLRQLYISTHTPLAGRDPISGPEIA